MEEGTFRRYPIGIQDFEDLRNNDYIYVDKTALIYQLVNTNKIYFLSRPRRFGKSLLVSTLEAYFLGKKELFNGLDMEQLEKDWTVYPVLHIDFSGSKYMEAESLRASINVQLLLWENVYGRQEGEDTFSLRLEGIIRRAYEQTGQQVVVLVDEYDAPMLDSNNNHELQHEISGIMRDFFSPLKKSGKYLRFLFLTGISKFSQMSIFSELNNLQNVSMSDNYSTICGITEQELLTQMKPSFIVWSAGYGPSPEKLARIAPGRGFTFSDGKRALAMAQRSLLEMADLLGKTQQAKRHLAEFDALMESLRPRFAGRGDRPLLMISLLDPRHVLVFGENCLFQEVLDRFGIKNAWHGEAAFWGSVTVAKKQFAFYFRFSSV